MQTCRFVAVWLGVGLCSSCSVPAGPLDRTESAAADGDAGAAADEAIAPRTAALRKFVQQAYVKASNTGAFDGFGHSIALSANGSTLAIGAPYEASAATGVDGNQADESVPYAGAVYVFKRHGKAWVQQAYLKASNTGRWDRFGFSVALSADGSALAVGAPDEASAATGIGGDQTSDAAMGAGAVYVFLRRGGTWSQEAYVKASNTHPDQGFGYSVALSADGSALAVGAVFEDSGAAGVNGDQADRSAPDAGAAYVFTCSGATWSQQAYVKASNPDVRSMLGGSIALAADGSTLAVGAAFEDSAATGIDGDQTDRSATYAGAVYVFTRSGTAWSQQAYVKASNTDAEDLFGVQVALAADGSTLAVGAIYEDSAATGVGGDQTSDAAQGAGAVYVFARSGAAWSQQAYVKASNTDEADIFGHAVALAADGATLAVGAIGESSAATGVDGDQADDSALAAGAVYVLARSGTTWSHQAYVKASNPDTFDQFGHSVALAADGAPLAVGARGESSAATGVDGDQADDSALAAGAAYVFDRRGARM
jgi:hypothetical protein